MALVCPPSSFCPCLDTRSHACDCQEMCMVVARRHGAQFMRLTVTFGGKKMRKFIMAALMATPIITFSHAGQAQDSKEPMRLPFPYIFSGPLIEFGERVWNEGVLPAVEVVN